jgi:hypothetical protein
MNVDEVMAELRAMGSESIKKILLKHGIKEPFFGVKVEYLKTIQKKVKTDYDLANGLFETGNADAMYLAGLITDDAKMTKADLQKWVELALSSNIGEYTVPWVAAGSRYGFETYLNTSLLITIFCISEQSSPRLWCKVWHRGKIFLPGNLWYSHSRQRSVRPPLAVRTATSDAKYLAMADCLVTGRWRFFKSAACIIKIRRLLFR